MSGKGGKKEGKGGGRKKYGMGGKRNWGEMEGGKEEDTWEFLVKVQIIYKLNKLVLQLDSLQTIFFIRAFKMLKKMKCKPMILSGPTDLQVESH